MEIKTPYLLFVGSEGSQAYAKTALGLLQWRPESCAGQLRLSDDAVDLGLENLTPSEAANRGVGTLVIGIASVGGGLDPSWMPVLRQALAAGLDLAGGLHTRLNDHPELVQLASAHGRMLHDVRTPPESLPVGTGRGRSGRRLLTVGTDCSVGKKYTALSIWRELLARGANADFRASGQTGVLIAGQGIPIDAVVGDFTSGAAELLSPDHERDHWDVIEGQGSLFHPGYAAVSLGLLHGSQPDAIVLCSDPSRTSIGSNPDYPVPGLNACIEHNLACGRLTSPDIRCIGVSMNTSGFSDRERDQVLRLASEETGLPCVDPLNGGVGPLVDQLEIEFGSFLRCVS
ncbi:MAG: DUF1611 domain-containing protein [Pseudomonadota bacterium]